MKLKKIAIFHCGFIYSGGGERIIIEEARELRKRGYLVDIFVPTYDPEKCYPELLKDFSVKTFLPSFDRRVPLKHALEMVLSSILAPLYAFRFREYDAIIGANQPGAWIAYCVSSMLNKPYVIYFNQPTRLLYPRKIDKETKWQNIREFAYLDKLIKLMRGFVEWADRMSVKSASKMLVNGKYIGSVIKDIYKREVVDCPAGAVIQPFNLLRVNPHTAYVGVFEFSNKAGKKFHVNKPYVLITNRHEPQKKFDYGLRAMAKLVEEYPDLKLYIPGIFTDETKKLMEISEKLGIFDKVVFVGQVTEQVLQKLYREAVVYWYTAPEEDFGMGVVEAMGWGVPVVAWKNAGPTVTIIDGVTGYLAKPYDIDDFVNKTKKAIEVYEMRAEMGKAAHSRVKKYFNWESHVDVMEGALIESMRA